MRTKVLKISGKWDGNAFAIMGNTKHALEDAKVPKEKIDEMLDKCTKGNYTHLIATCVEALTEAGYEVR